jgi:hypothetical protein
MLGVGLGVMASQRRQPHSAAALDLNFTRGVYRRNGLIRDLDQIMGFARATPATYVDADGAIQTAGIDVPRFDWTGGKRALLLEDAATNLLPLAAQLSGSWARQGVSGVSNLAGALSDDAGVFTAVGSAAHYVISPQVSFTIGQTYASKVYIDTNIVNSARFVQIALGYAAYGENAFANFDLSGPGAVTRTVGTTARVVRLTPNLYLLEVVGITTATALTAGFGCAIIENGLVGRLAGNTSTQKVKIDGGQVELGGVSTSFIPTAVSAVTRAADIVTPIDLSGFDLTGGYTALISGWLDGVRGGFDRLLQLDGGGDETRQVALYASSSSGFRGAIFSGGVVQAGSAGAGLRPLPAEFRIAWSVGSNIYDFAQDGVAHDHSDHVVYDPPEFMRLGTAPVGGQPKRLRLSRVSIYPRVMTTAQLEEITA